jgi:predicted acylesterase/phospholipase RssA
VLSGWSALAGRINPFRPKPRVPGIVELLLRTTETGAALSSSALEKTASVVLHPPVSEFALLDFAKLDDLVEAGYQYTMDQIAAWDSDRLAMLMSPA